MHNLVNIYIFRSITSKTCILVIYSFEMKGFDKIVQGVQVSDLE